MPDVKILLWLPCLFALIPACGFAQVTVNPAALRQLAGLPAVQPAAVRAQPAVARPFAHTAKLYHAHHAKPEAVAPAKPAKPQAVPQPEPRPVSKPVLAKPTALPIARIEFAPGSAALPAGAASVLKPFCAAGGTVSLVARAPADPADPSSAMRLSMARAFAIRDALTSCGVPASGIIPRAAGTVPGADENQALIGASAAP